MELLDKLVLPVSGGHLNLLRYLLVLAVTMFLAYSSLLFAALITSINYSFKKSTEESNFQRLTKDIIDLITSAPLIWFALGIAPFIAIILIYTQLLHNLESSVVAYFTFSFFFYCAAIASVYYFKQSIYISSVSKLVGDESIKESKLGDFFDNNGMVKSSSRLFGALFLTVSIWLFMGATSSAISPETWSQSIFDSMFNMLTTFKLLAFVSFSFLLLGMTFVFSNYYWSDNKVNDNANVYEIFAKKQMSNLALSSIIFVPIFYALSIVYVPKSSISFNMFLFGVLALIFVLIGVHFVYVAVKENSAKYIATGFWLVILSLLFMTAQDQTAFTVSTESNVLLMASEYDKIHLEKAGAGNVVEINAEEIYKNRCSACHKFDVKQVTAPAYNEVLPKYIGNEQEMIKFILNPYPVNKQDYPAGMASQGLKPNEAKAIVEYLLSEVKKNTVK